MFLHSIHMECFGDLEQYRRSREDALVKKERSVQIATKYLNRMYFFGPNSPATVQQQDEVQYTRNTIQTTKCSTVSAYTSLV